MPYQNNNFQNTDPSTNDKTAKDNKTSNSDKTAKDNKTSNSDKATKDNKTSNSDKATKDNKTSNCDKAAKDNKTLNSDRVTKDNKTSNSDKVTKDNKTSNSDKATKDNKTPNNDKALSGNKTLPGDPVKINLPFPVVGIGASAGGLEALQPFFENITSPPGAAFIIIQHLSPDHQSYMVELLSRHTFLPVSFIEDGVKIEPNHVYLIPPKVNITIHDGVLHFSAIVGHGLNLPIDIFFLSLAEDQRNNAVAIIFSGAGSDGTLGIRAVKEFGGITMVQDPEDAHFDGMPISALGTNMIDLVLPAPALAHELVSYLEHSQIIRPNKSHRPLTDNQTLYNQILSILKEAKHVDFSAYRQDTIVRRLEKRISLNRFDKLKDYVRYLADTPKEVDILYYEILIGVTRFFRDPAAFDALEKDCFPHLFNNITNGELRIWVASCSTGEEAYSIAILLKEYMLKNHVIANVKIFATDIDDRSLKFASKGIYPQNVASDVPTQYLAKYFSPNNKGYQISSDIRNMIIFATQDLIANPPFFRMDLITCRNFLIYIHSEAQKKVLSSFYAGLKTGGILFLGSSESLDDLSKGFDTISAKGKIFRKHDGYTPDYSPKAPMPLHVTMLESLHDEGAGSFSQMNRELLDLMEQINNSFLPPSLITDADNNIIYAIRDAGKLLHINSGRVSTNLLNILPRDLSLIVSSLIRRATGREDIISTEVVFDDKPTLVQCKQILSKYTTATYFFLTFEEIKNVPKDSFTTSPKMTDLSDRYQERIDELEYEINRHKENLRTAIAQLETSNEELQASNEELVASNEELQSSNEELQSVNEELYTVNIEHVHKLQEITELNNDYDNLLSNTLIGTLFLDPKLVVRKISKLASKILNILQSDIGKPLDYFSLGRIYPQFIKDVERVNSSKRLKEKELTQRKKTYWMRIVPYLTDEKEYKGVIITFVDLTDCKMRALKEAYESQEKVRNSSAQLEAATTIARMAYFQIDVKTKKCSGSKLFPELWPQRDGCVVPLADWIDREDLPETQESFNNLLSEKVTNILISFRSRFYDELRFYRMSASIGRNSAGDKFVNGVIQNVTHFILNQQRQEAQKRFFSESFNAIPGLFYAKDADDGFRYVFANRFFLGFIEKTMDDILGKTDEEITPSGGRFLREDAQVLISDTALSFENEVKTTSGETRYFHTTKWKSLDARGHRLIMGIASDVTEQKLVTQDFEAANHCLSVLVDSKDLHFILNEIMKSLCERLLATHCFLMSYDYNNMTTRCEYEYINNSEDELLFANTDPMPFSTQNEWYQCYLKNSIFEVRDLTEIKESVDILEKYCGHVERFKGKSLYAISFRNQNTIAGAICFICPEECQRLSQARLSYLMSMASNLFRNILLKRQDVNETILWPEKNIPQKTKD